MAQGKKPNFFIVGAPKCGTTAIFEYLKQHPDIYMHPYKESNFFAEDLMKTPHEYSQVAVDRYLNRFSQARDESVVGDASIWHLYSKEASNKIKEFNPDAKILIMLRSPIEQMHSLHSQLVYGGIEPLSLFQDALKAESQRKREKSISKINPGATNLSYKCLLYREIASFSDQVGRYFETFNEANIRVVLFDELKQNPELTYEKILNFLRIDTSFNPEFKVFNSNKVRRYNGKLVQKVRTHSVSLWVARTFLPLFVRESLGRNMSKIWGMLNSIEKPRTPLNDSLKKELIYEFVDEIEDLSKLINKDLSSWLNL